MPGVITPQLVKCRDPEGGCPGAEPSCQWTRLVGLCDLVLVTWSLVLDAEPCTQVHMLQSLFPDARTVSTASVPLASPISTGEEDASGST